MLQLRMPIAWMIAAAVALCSSGCRKDPAPPKWDIDLVAPVAKASLGIGDLIADSLIHTDADERISILHTFNLFTLKLDTVLTAPDTSFNYAYALPFAGPIQFQPGTTFEASNDVTRFNLDDLQLTRLVVRSGTVNLAITNMMNGIILGNFSLPGATLAGAPLQLELTLPPGTPATPVTVQGSRTLDGYAFDLRGPQFASTNELATQLNYMSAPWAGPITISGQDSLLATVSYHGIVPEYATGSFGTRQITVEPAVSTLDLFQHISGLLDLDAVNATLLIRNGLGVDARARIQYLRSTNSTTGNTIELAAPVTASPLNIDRALDLGGGYQPALNTYVLNQVNSNIDQFVENLPDQIGYALDLTLNPLGNISNNHDFLYHDSRIDVELKVDIPLRLIATGLALRKTMDVDLPGNAEAHAWRSGTLHLFATNGFPFSAQIQLAVANAQGDALEFLPPGGTIPTGILGNDGFVEQTSATKLDFGISPAQMQLLQQTGKLVVVATFNTADQQHHVQLLERYRLDVKLALDANFVVNGNE